MRFDFLGVIWHSVLIWNGTRLEAVISALYYEEWSCTRYDSGEA